MTENEITVIAQGLSAEYGDLAPHVAAGRADAAQAFSNRQGEDTWRAVQGHLLEQNISSPGQ